ncbi:MAG: MFS transporter [Gammaproteobacteria bacterium]|nr:MFS transporter [Gammaproteobacteria bacterium]MBS03330.1 MFS transporter [Gammaproteobacteria bacterium]|tara:strand:+ start:7805 stop:9037 length:1233 start_codon:yes stop_codon:yes gene_type:complete
MAEASSNTLNVKAVGLISGAHLYSHFYILLLPPLFPLLTGELDVGFTELGFAITVFSLVTGLTQTPVGFLVDRVGARLLLIAALVAESIAFIVIAIAPSYPMLLVMMGLAGLANAVYHPADYSILNGSVGEKHIGRAFSVHTASGFFGGFLAPAIVLPLTTVIGWQWAVGLSAATGLGMALVLVVGAGALQDADNRDEADGAAEGQSGLAVLLSVPVLMGLLFYVGISTSGHGVSDFSVSALGEMYPAALTTLGGVLLAYLFANPVGVLAGGWIADSIKRHDVFAAACFVGVALPLFAIAGLDLPLIVVAAALFVVGFLNGVVSPSRDMLIRAMTPPGQMGKVFGFVSTGFNIGGIIAPPAFGWLLDQGSPTSVYWGAGLVALLTVPTVLVTGLQGRRAATRWAAEDAPA